MILLPDRTRVQMVQDLLASGQFLRLYMNPVLPSSGGTGAEYEEVMAPGYMAQLLRFEDWRITEGDVEAAEQGFLFLAPPFPPIYGYYLTERVTNRYLWADAFLNEFGRPTPIVPSVPNYELWVTPCLRFRHD